jgi:uncharacterized membrane protein
MPVAEGAAAFARRVDDGCERMNSWSGRKTGMRTNPIRFFQAQPRFFISVLVGGLLWFLLPRGWLGSTRLLVAWDLATGLYLILATMMMARSDTVMIRNRAAEMDEGQMAILGATIITALVGLGGVVAVMATAKTLKGPDEWRHVLLAGLTVPISWSFLHTMFAIHYAHEFYGGSEDEPDAGLEFPGKEPPDYWDFVYYSFVIGTACATADVNVTSRIMRRLTTLHCVVAFFFNTTILALTVNIGAGLF